LSREPRAAAIAMGEGKTETAEVPRDGDMADGVGDGFDVLNFINFQWDVVSPQELSGRFIVKPKCSQVGPNRRSCFLRFECMFVSILFVQYRLPAN